MNEKTARKFVALTELISEYNIWLEPFSAKKDPYVTGFGLPHFIRRGLKYFGYMRKTNRGDTEQETVIPFDPTLKKYIAAAVRKRKREFEKELDELKHGL